MANYSKGCGPYSLGSSNKMISRDGQTKLSAPIKQTQGPNPKYSTKDASGNTVTGYNTGSETGERSFSSQYEVDAYNDGMYGRTNDMVSEQNANISNAYEAGRGQRRQQSQNTREIREGLGVGVGVGNGRVSDTQSGIGISTGKPVEEPKKKMTKTVERRKIDPVTSLKPKPVPSLIKKYKK